MIILLNADKVADRLGVHRRTAMALMMEMSPVAISGNVRKRYRVSEDNLEKWILKHSNGMKPPVSRIGTGTERRLQRKG